MMTPTKKGQVEVAKAFENHFKNLLRMEKQPMDTSIFTKMLNRAELGEEIRESLVSPVTEEEIKGAIFSFEANKSPGPDGFGAYFFQQAW